MPHQQAFDPFCEFFEGGHDEDEQIGEEVSIVGGGLRMPSSPLPTMPPLVPAPAIPPVQLNGKRQDPPRSPPGGPEVQAALPPQR